jgi:hypothetical protein
MLVLLIDTKMLVYASINLQEYVSTIDTKTIQ